MLFVDREAELSSLARRLDEGTPQFFRVYGRRRLGKTELLKQLVKERNALFLTLGLGDLPTQLRSLSHQVGEAMGVPPRPYAELHAFLDHLEELRPEIVVLDEFQRLIESDVASVSELQRRWDHRWKERGPTLVLCGSSVGMMQGLTTRRPGPLYGRLTGDLHLGPMEYAGIRLLYPHLEEEDRIRRYAVFGATPFYHLLGLRRDLRESVEEAFLRPQAPLRDEPEFVLRLEVHEPARYVAVLDAMGKGAHAIHDLESQVGVAPGGLGSYLHVLRHDLDLVEVEVPVAGKARMGRYAFRDPFFDFYYRFVSDALPRLASSTVPRVWGTIARDLEGHVGRVFERVVHEAFRLANGTSIRGIPCRFDQVGAWWDRRGEEIDVVALGAREVWAGEVKWSKDPVPVEVVHRLLDKIARAEVARRHPVRPFVVSRRGLSTGADELLRTSHGFSLTLAELRGLFEHRSPPSLPA